ncbi:MAG TPA: S53 family peptidase [Streptosporangiaceae bacterium]|nr:S53 family peptidase [Streptosporangiaceae bacterium]
MKKNLKRLRVFGLVGAASMLAVGVSVVATAPVSASVNPGGARVALAGTRTGLATSKTLQKAAPALPAHITADVYLADRNTAALTAFAQAVSTPGTAQYHHYLTAAQDQAMFAPTAAEARAVEGWATSNGLRVGTVTSGFGASIQVTGTPGAIQSAFDVKFGSYQVGAKKKAEKFWAPEQSASVPASIEGDVLTVTGLDSAKHQATPSETLPPPEQNYFIAPWTSEYYGQKVSAGKYGTVAGTTTKIPTVNGQAQPWTNAGYTPAQVRGAYNVAQSGETGKGVTVAVIDAYIPPTLKSDANQYAEWSAAQPGGSPALDKPFTNGQFKTVLHPGASTWTDTSPSVCDAAGWYEESSLDVESVHGMAPNANVTYVAASSCSDQGLTNAVAYVVNTHAASIVTDSWGEPYDTDATVAVDDQLFEAAAAEGIGFFFSAGDSGYEDPNYEDPTDQVEVDYPDSSPWVTSVGGTSLAIGKNDNYEGETSWGTFLNPLTVSSTGQSSWAFTPGDTVDELTNGLYDGSTGGGVAYAYAQPWYQRGVVPTSLADTLVTSTPVTYNTGTTTYGTVTLAYNESLATASSPRRVTPDVSALADPSTGVAVGETTAGPDNAQGVPGPDKFYISRIGGTSVASPIFAGIEADAQQAAGQPIGFANPAIYGLDAHTSRTFHNVTDHPGGASYYEVRSNYTDPSNETLPLVTYLRQLGADGYTGSNVTFPAIPAGALGAGSPALPSVTVNLESALVANGGYSDATGVGSPDNYIAAFQSNRGF